MVWPGSNTRDVNNPTEQAAWAPGCPHVARPVCLDSCFGPKARSPGTSPIQLNLQGPHNGEKPGPGLHHNRTGRTGVGLMVLGESGPAHPPSSNQRLGGPRQPWPGPASNLQTHNCNSLLSGWFPWEHLLRPTWAMAGSQAYDLQKSPAC